MQSENELAAAAEKAAREKDLQNWELSSEKERAAAQFDREEGKKKTDDLIKELVASRTSYVMKLTMDGMHKSPIMNRIGYEEDKQKILDLVAAEKKERLEEPKQAYLKEQAAARELQKNEAQQQHLSREIARRQKMAGLREWSQREREKQWDKELQAEKEAEFTAAGQEITTPNPNTSENVQTHPEEAKKQAAEQQKLLQDEPERYLFGVQVVNDSNRKLREIEWEIKRQKRAAAQAETQQEVTKPKREPINPTRDELDQQTSLSLEAARRRRRTRGLGL
jgi:hypothetical protein